MDRRSENFKRRRSRAGGVSSLFDPDALYALVRRALRDAAWDEAVAPADRLLQWLAEEGPPPRITGTRTVDRIIAESTCRAVAAWEPARRSAHRRGGELPPAPSPAKVGRRRLRR